MLPFLCPAFSSIPATSGWPLHDNPRFLSSELFCSGLSLSWNPYLTIPLKCILWHESLTWINYTTLLINVVMTVSLVFSNTPRSSWAGTKVSVLFTSYHGENRLRGQNVSPQRCNNKRDSWCWFKFGVRPLRERPERGASPLKHTP